MLLLAAVLAFSGCSALTQPVAKGAAAPTPVVNVEPGGEENPDIYVDPAEFKEALLKAIAAQDREKLQMWMTGPFLTGTWRADLSDTPPADALQELYASELGAQHQLELVKEADLKALMGGSDPLSIPRAEAGVIEAALVSGWGLDGRDEALLFIARQPDNSLKWHGWMRVNGGFSGARFGGVKAYTNETLGFSVFLPKDYQVNQSTEQYISIVAPAVEGAGHPGLASISVEPANGRTAEEAARQVYLEAKEILGEGGSVTITAAGVDGEPGYVVVGVPGQDMHRQMFVVHNGLLYWFFFTPDEPQHSPVSYTQMEDIFAMVMNTFHFTN